MFASPKEPDSQSNEEAAPNVLAAERELLKAFGDTEGSAERGHLTIGIISTFGTYEYLPFWHSLLSKLGYSVLIPDFDRVDLFANAASKTITSDNVCTPAKSVHYRIFEMIDRGANGILIPTYKRNIHCAVLCGYARVIEGSIPWIKNGDIALISPYLSYYDLYHLFSRPEEFDSVYEALCEFDQETAPTPEEFRAAFEYAHEKQDTFAYSLHLKHRDAVNWAFSDKDRQAVIIAGRPYYLTERFLRGIDERFAENGFAVISSRSIKASIRRDETYENMEKILKSHSVFYHWLANTSSQEECMHLVFLQMKDCGFDDLAVATARKVISNMGRRSASLYLDDGKSDAGLLNQVNIISDSFMSEHSYNNLEEDELLSPAQAIELLVDSYQGENLRVDADQQFDGITNKLCSTVSYLFDNVLTRFEEDPSLNEIHLYPICENCMVDSLQPLISEHLGRDIHIHWDKGWDGPKSLKVGEVIYPPDHDEASDEYVPKIGIMGNPLVCFNHHINETLMGMIHHLGGAMILPLPELLQTEDTSYPEQLERFRSQGADGVLYLSESRCIKGHVDGRGSLQSLQMDNPDMNLVSVDVETMLTSLTLKNRIRLLLVAARDKHAAKMRLSQEG